MSPIGTGAAVPFPDAFASFAMPPPDVDEDGAARIAADRFGLAGTAHRLTGERDANFRVDANGRSYVLKVAHDGAGSDAVGLQMAALTHLERAAPTLPVPRIVPAAGGASFAKGMIAGKAATMRMLTFVPGVPADRLRLTMGQISDVGALLGRLTTALSTFSHPDAEHPIPWDLRYTSTLTCLVSQATDGDEVAAASIISTFDDKVLPRLEALPRQVVHNDLNPHNIVFVDNHPAGVIDFGDLTDTCRANDLAIALSYHIDGGSDWPAKIKAFMGGYAVYVALGEDERALLPDLVTTRLAVIVALTAWRARRIPANSSYILRNASAARVGLGAVCGAGGRRALEEAVGCA